MKRETMVQLITSQAKYNQQIITDKNFVIRISTVTAVGFTCNVVLYILNIVRSSIAQYCAQYYNDEVHM